MKNPIFSIILSAFLAVIVFTGCAVPPEPAPEPTASPTDAPNTEAPTAVPEVTKEPMPTFPPDEWLLDDAWSVFSRVAQVHGIELDRSIYTIRSNPDAYQSTVNYYEKENGAGVSGLIEADKDGYGHVVSGDDMFRAAFDQMQFIFPEDWQEPEDLYDETKNNEFFAKLDGVTVTPEDIAAYGCTAESGTTEYLEAVAACYAEKLTSFYTEADAGFHRCYEAAVGAVELKVEERGVFLIRLAVRPIDIFSFTMIRSLYYSINDGSTDERLFGWINVSDYVAFEQREDGSWIGIRGQELFTLD